MKSVDLEQLRSVVSKLKTPDRVASYYRCSYEVAERMIFLAKEGRQRTNTEEAKQPMLKPVSPPQTNPKFDPLEWSYQKEKMDMERASRNLLIAMLIEGQHWLSEEQAINKARELGLLPYPTT